MTNTPWTPGPWRIAGKTTGHIWAPDGDGVVEVARVGNYRDTEILRFNKDRWDADARLIAAAPDLFAALDALMNGTMEYKAANQAARAALAKARGEA